LEKGEGRGWGGKPPPFAKLPWLFTDENKNVKKKVLEYITKGQSDEEG
jgi:hypothetical protein